MTTIPLVPITVLLAGFSIPAPLWALSGIIVGAVVNLWRGKRTDDAEKRKTSGSIATTDATTLWEASEQLRHDLRDEVTRLRAEILELRERHRAAMSELSAKVKQLEDEVASLNEHIRLLEEGR